MFIPESIPFLSSNWESDRASLSFELLAFEILSLYISLAEILCKSLKSIIRQSYSSFREPSVTPTVTLDGVRKIHLLELFHGLTFAFKDVALQLRNLLKFFLGRRNQARFKTGQEAEHLTVIWCHLRRHWFSRDLGSEGENGLSRIYHNSHWEDFLVAGIFLLHGSFPFKLVIGMQFSLGGRISS
jgi:Threonine synthase N terminus